MLNFAQPYFFALAYIVVLYIRPQEFVPSFMGTPLVPGLLGFATLFWLVAQKKSFEAPQHGLLIGLAIGIFLSGVFAGWMGGAVAGLVDFAPTMLLFYVVATSVDSTKRFREMGMVLTGVCCVMAYHSILQAATEDGIGWTGAKMIDGRVTYLGFLSDPNDLAMAFVMTMPMTLHLAATTRFFVVRPLYYAAAALIAYGIFLCNSRGSLLALGAMVLAVSVHRFGLVRSLIVAPILGLPLIFLAPSRLGEISADEESAAGRVDAWYEGFQMLMSRPLFGVGKGGFIENHPLTAHNSFVLAIAELGVVGYFFWLSIVVLSGLMLYRMLKAQPPAEPQPVQAAAERIPRWQMTPEQISAEQLEVAAKNDWDDWKSVSRCLAYSFIGTMVAAFFLSRTYIPILFLLLALVVAVHQAMQVRWPTVARILLRDQFKALVAVEVASIFGLWLLTRVLLGMG